MFWPVDFQQRLSGFNALKHIVIITFFSCVNANCSEIGLVRLSFGTTMWLNNILMLTNGSVSLTDYGKRTNC